MKGVVDRNLNYYIENIISDFYLSLLIQKRIFLFDGHGIPIVKYRFTDLRNYYNPATVSIWGFYNLRKYIERGDCRRLSYVRNCVEWLYDNSEETSYGGFVWRYNMEWSTHGLKSGWISGMSQGLAISLLLRGEALFKKHEYGELAEKSFSPMTVPVENGGVAIIKDDFYWIEEIPSRSPSMVLNGFIFALFGIYDLYRFTRNRSYKKWFDRATLTLAKMLPRYDLGTWSRYDLGLKLIRSKMNVMFGKVFYSSEKHNIATPSYNTLHVNQLNELYKITKIPQFKYYSSRWGLNPLKYAELLTYILST